MGAVVMETISYGGWKRALRLSNGIVELLATLEVGPRILRFGFVGGANVLKEIPEELGGQGEAQFMMRGGHRLWTSPEDPARTFAPDNGPVDEERLAGSVALTTPADPDTGLERTMRLVLDETKPRLTIEHVIRNRSAHSHTLAPWALTVLAPGGTAVFPLPAYAPHPGNAGKSATDFAPQLSLALWPYFRFTDRRFTFGDRFVRIQQDPRARGPAKIGAGLREAWAAYQLADLVFIKRFPFDEGRVYPDGNCNFESYTDAGILELESLGALSKLEPGDEVLHTETWSLHERPAGFDVTSASEDLLAATFAPWLGNS